MATPGESELTLLKKRRGRDYSYGHQKMYTGPIQLLSRKPTDVLDVGSGIGWGLDQMLAEGVVQRYVGLEPDRLSFEYTQSKFESNHRVEFHNTDLQSWEDDRVFSHVFCIEVIEHLDDRLSFLRELARRTVRNLFLSTPDNRKSSHGDTSPVELVPLIQKAGFRVAVVSHHWTDFYLCEKL